MPFPGQFHRLVIIGSVYDDIFNTSLSIVPNALGELGMPAVDDATLTAVKTTVQQWFTGTGGIAGFSPIQNVKLVGIKLNRIGTDGRYVDPVTKEHIYPSPIAGSVSVQLPAQVSLAATFRTAIPRGRGSHGRMYLPPSASISSLDTDGRVSVAGATNVSASVKDFVAALNSTYTLIGRVGVASDAGPGRFEHVTRVEVGRVVDTVRSRRSKLQEDYQGTDV